MNPTGAAFCPDIQSKLGSFIYVEMAVTKTGTMFF
jgi:hypothetical protein